MPDESKMVLADLQERVPKRTQKDWAAIGKNMVAELRQASHTGMHRTGELCKNLYSAAVKRAGLRKQFKRVWAAGRHARIWRGEQSAKYVAGKRGPREAIATPK